MTIIFAVQMFYHQISSDSNVRTIQKIRIKTNKWIKTDMKRSIWYAESIW